MGDRGGITRVLAAAGTLLVWAPVLGMLLTGAAHWARSGRLRFDWLMPAELFPAAIVGGVLLLVGAWRARSQLRVVSWTLGLMVAFLVGSLLLALITGLASGRTEPGGWQSVLVSGGIVAYALGLVVLGVAGVLLLTNLFAQREQTVAS